MAIFRKHQTSAIRRFLNSGGILFSVFKRHDENEYRLSTISKIAHEYRVTVENVTTEHLEVQRRWLSKAIHTLSTRLVVIDDELDERKMKTKTQPMKQTIYPSTGVNLQ